MLWQGAIFKWESFNQLGYVHYCHGLSMFGLCMRFGDSDYGSVVSVGNRPHLSHPFSLQSANERAAEKCVLLEKTPNIGPLGWFNLF